VSEETFRCIVQKSALRRELFRSRSRFEKAFLRFVFGALTGKLWMCKYSVVFCFSSLDNIKRYHDTKQKHIEASRQCKSLLKADKGAYFSKIGDAVIDAFDRDDSRSMHRAIKDLLSVCRSHAKTTKFIRIVDDKSRPAQSLRDERILFRGHFADLLGGTPCKFEYLVRQDRFVNSSRHDGVDPLCLPKCIPSVPDLIMLFNSYANGKGFGEGRICTDVFKKFSKHLAVYYFPLYVKTFVRVQPPLQWKGGLLAELFKGKGSPSMRGNYRDVLLADDSGKAVGKLIRRRFLPFAVSLSHASQYGGGFNGGETAFTQLHVRLCIDAAIHMNLSVGCLYLDVIAAFATMLRRIVFNSEGGDDWLRCHVLASLKMTSKLFTNMFAIING
jgi:hypothetical protein